MNRITTAELRKKWDLMTGKLIIDKMSQGRDKKTAKTFVVIEVEAGVSDEFAIASAIDQLKRLGNHYDFCSR